MGNNPDSVEKDIRIFTGSPCPASKSSSFDINASVSFEGSSSPCGSSTAKTSPLTSDHERDKWPRPSERKFSEHLLNHFGKSLSFCMDAKLAGCEPGLPKGEST